MKKSKGFTLIEILAVITIIGIIGLIGIGAITRNIEESRQSTFIDIARTYINGARNIKGEDKLSQDPKDREGILIPFSIIELGDNKDYKSPYGEIDLEKSYVVILNNKDFFTYYVTMKDDENHALYMTKAEDLDTDKIITDKEKIDKIYDVEQLKTKKYTIETEEAEYKVSDRNNPNYKMVLLDIDNLNLFKVSYETRWTNKDKKIKIEKLNENENYEYIITNENIAPDENDAWSTSDEYLKDVGTYYVFAKNENGRISKGKEFVIDKIDKTPPESTIFTYEKAIDSITIKVSSTDAETGIYGYQYSKDGGATWSDISKSSEYKFENLTEGAYLIKVRSYNGTYETSGEGDNNYKDSDVISISTNPVTKPTYTSSPSGWSQSKRVKITYASGYTNEYSIDGGITWNLYSGEVEFTENGTIIGRLRDNENYLAGSTYTVTGIDNTKPTTAAISYTKSSNNIKVTATGIDPESGISMYQFSKDDGANWTPLQESNTYDFTNLTTGTYKIRVKVVNGTYANNGANEKNTLESEATEVMTTTIIAPTMKVSPTGWSQSKSVTITYPSGSYTKQYSTDGGLSWNDYIGAVSFTAKGNIIARVTDGTNYVSSASQAVSSIDTTAPTGATFTYSVSGTNVTVTASGTDAESGISQYQFSKDNGTTWTAAQTSSVYTFSGQGTYNIKIKVINGTYTNNGINDNNSLVSALQTVVTDTTPPVIAVTSSYTSATSANVIISVTDNGGSGLDSSNKYQYYLSTSSSTQTGGSWKNYTSGTAFTVTGTAGYYYLWLYPVKDGAGNISGGKTNTNTAYVAYTLTLYSYTGNFSYTGAAQTFTTKIKGKYKIEAWGASGGAGVFTSSKPGCQGGNGAYTSGVISLNQGDTLYVYVGKQGVTGTRNNVTASSFNGGGAGGDGGSDDGAGSGGGATDIRLNSGAWNNATGLRSRIMVAGGGGGGSCVENSNYATADTINNRHAAGLINSSVKVYCYNTRNSPQSTPEVSQTTGYKFGYGISGGTNSNQDTHGQGGGGGGYWGGSGASDRGNTFEAYRSGGTGGTSYISGHTGCVAVASASSSSAKSGCTTGTSSNACSVHYSGKVFTSTVMKSGKESMPNTSNGTETGHSGNGYARITYVGQ